VIQDINPSDWIAVHQLVATFADALDRHDPEAFLECWTKRVYDFTDRDLVIREGEDQTVDRQFVVDKVVEIWKKRSPHERFRHLVTNILVLERSDTTMKLRVGIAWATVTSRNVHVHDHYGYEDDVVKEDGQWRFQSRRILPYKRVIGET
jgi:3-phenylpropionate/cinnamic acid dioxygenase small subunit